METPSCPLCEASDFPSKSGSSRIWLQRCVMPCKGRDDPRCSGMVSGHTGRRGLLHACVDASATAEGWKRGRGPSAFFGRYLSRHPRPHPRCRRPAASAPEPDPTKPRCAILRSMGPRKPGAFAQGLTRGDGSRDRASGEAGTVGRGALRRERCLRKNADGPLPRFGPAAVPCIPRNGLCAPQRPTCMDTGAARGDLAMG
jgi:hypothetical protein